MTYLYFISNERQKVVKIGIAKNPEKRLKTFQTAHYEKLIILKVVSVSNRTLAFQLETALHQKFQKYHIRGEWFKLTPTLFRFIENFQEDRISLVEKLIIFLSRVFFVLAIILMLLCTFKS